MVSQTLRRILIVACSLAMPFVASCTPTPKQAPKKKIVQDKTLLAPLKFEGETFGRFVGTLQHDRLGKEQLAKLDFIAGRVASTNELEIRAVLSLYFGGFDSQEYISYHFENVRYNLLTGTLVFNQSDQLLSLIASKFSAAAFSAEVHAGSTKVGMLTLNRAEASPARPLLDQVAGEYLGSCDGASASLHIWTTRTLGEASRIGNPFGTYEVRGTLGSADTDFCGSNRDQNCVTDVIKGGTYDFFAGSLQLTGARNSYECSVEGQHLNCGPCTFDRQNTSTTIASVPTPPVNKLLGTQGADVRERAFIEATSAGIAGEYVGYVHHERLDVYQRGGLEIQTFQGKTTMGSRLMMAANARLHFDDAAAAPAITYSFNQREYDLRDQAFVFERMVDDVDAIIQVTALGGGIVRGVWYSQHFGRVGTFEFRKSGYSDLPEGARRFQSIAGTYRAGALELSLATRLDTTPISSLNPFFPISFGGRFRFPEAQTEWIQIEAGSYDFYTGKVGFTTSREGQVFAGSFDAGSGELSMTKASRSVATYQESFAPEAFTRQPAATID